MENFARSAQVSLDIVAVIARLQVADKLPFTACSLIVQGAVCVLEPADSSLYLCDLNGAIMAAFNGRDRARKFICCDFFR